MKNLKNLKDLKDLKTLKDLKNIEKFFKSSYMLSIIAVLIIGYMVLSRYFMDSSSHKTEPYISSACKVNATLPNIDGNIFSKKHYGSETLYGCNNSLDESLADAKMNFYIYNSGSSSATLDFSSIFTDVSQISGITDISTCVEKTIAGNRDFFAFDSANSKCFMANIDYSVASTDENVLYISCVGDSDLNKDISGLHYLGQGLITEKGYGKIENHNFSRIAQLNKYCIDDKHIDTNFSNLQTCLQEADSSDNKLAAAGDCFRIHGSSIIGEISANYADTWSNFKSFQIGTIDGSSNYNRDFIYDDWIVPHSSMTDTQDLVARNQTLTADLDETGLDYTSNFMLYIFLTVVLVIAFVLAILSMTNPDIVSAEIIIAYVIFIMLITYFLYGRQRIEKNIDRDVSYGGNIIADTLSKFNI